MTAATAWLNEAIIPGAVKAGRRQRSIDALLSSCARSALSVLPAMLSLGIASPSNAQTVLPSSATTVDLSTFGTAGNPFVVNLGTTISAGSSTAAAISGLSGSYILTNNGTLNGGSAINGSGINLDAGSSVTNSTTGVISGGGLGIRVSTPGGSASTVINNGSITATGTYNSAAGVYIGNGGNLTNSASITGGVYGVRLFGVTTVINTGTITGTNQTGVYVEGGGSLTNRGSASVIQGARYGVLSNYGFLAVINDGRILATAANSTGVLMANAGGSVTNNASGTISGGGFGVRLPHISTVTNSGAITGTETTGTGVSMAGGGSLTNNSTGTITGGQTGVSIGSTGTVSNSGSITGTTGVGVALTGAGMLTNNGGGVVQGGQYGVQVAAGGTVNNAGTIKDSGVAGASLGSNTTLSNSATGTVSGVTGVIFTGTGAGVTNNGAIVGSGGVAVQFDAGVNTLTLDTGSNLTGSIDGGGGAGQIVLTGSGAMSNTIANFGASGALAIASGAAWLASGAWTIATVTNAGSLQPGAAGSSLHITGNYVQSSTGVLQVAVTPDGRSSQLQVTGPATLNGTVSVLAANGAYQPSTSFTVLTSSAGLTGQFTGVSSNFAFLTPTLSYDTDDAFLTLVLKTTSPGDSTPMRFSNIAQTPNQFNTAEAIQNGGAGSPLYNAVVGQTAGGARQAFDTLSGEAYASTNSALLDGSLVIRQNVLDRMRQDSFGNAGGPFAAFDAIAPVAQGSGSRPAGNGLVPGTERAAAAQWTAWGQSFGSWGHGDGNGKAAGFNENHSGFTAGLDTRIDNTWRVGGAVGYMASNVDIAERNSAADIDTANFALYADRAFGAFKLRLGAAYAWNNVAMNRIAEFPGFWQQLRSSYAVQTAQTFGEVGYGFNVNGLALEPFGGLAYLHLGGDNTSESGGSAALNVLGAKEDVGYSTLGLKAATTFSGPYAVTPWMTVAWQHAFGDVTPVSNVAFSGTGSAFTVSGVPIARDAGLVEIGADWAIKANVRIGLSYQGTLAHNATDNQAKGHLTWAF
jgi:outer membrane autotransporter protein